MKRYFIKIIRRLKKEWRDKYNMPFRLIRVVNQFIISHSRNTRPSSYPYISGDSFRAVAHHVFDGLQTINPEKVKFEDVIFVDIHKFYQFIREIHPNIKNKYKLVTHNGDITVDSELAKLVDDKIIHWFAQNVKISHPKITPIPIGLENLHYYNNGIIKNINRIKKIKLLKHNKILFSFNIATNPLERQYAYDILLKVPNAEGISVWPNAFSYLKLLNSYKFVISPPGNGIDCHRTWEAMYLGVVPIVKNSLLTKFFFDLGLPILIVDDWSELIDLTPSELEKKYFDIKSSGDVSALYMDYWLREIKLKGNKL